jgi:prepilin-type processing-associated H-X9-DG protein
MSFALLGLGTAVPSTTVDQTTAMGVTRSICCRTAEHETWLPVIFSQTGIRSRRMVFEQAVVDDVVNGTAHTGSEFLPRPAPDDRGPSTGQRMQHYVALAPGLAKEAAGRALQQARLDPADVTHLITVSCTGFRAPGLDYELIRGLGLPPTTERTHIGFMGCHGALNGLRVADAFAGSQPSARILLCAVELCVLHFFYGWDPEKMVANALFADGSAAVAGVPAALAPAGAWRVAATGSCYIPDSAKDMTWTIGDHGFEMTLTKRVPGLIANHLRPWLESWLSKNGLGLDQVRSWAIHPGGPRILAAVEEALGLTREQTSTGLEILAEYGNMSSPTVLFIIDRLRMRQAPLPCVALGFGPGMVAEATLFA